MDLNLNGKRALVTGSTAGIGAAIAAGLAREGAQVIVNGRSPDAVEKAVATLKAESGGEVIGFAGDLGTAGRSRTSFAVIPRSISSSTTWASLSPKPFEDIPDADWMRFFEVNVLSGVRLSRAYLPAMKRANWGRIIFISSESALQIPAEMIHYGVTKTAQIAVARGLAETLAGTGITVNSVLPGPTRSRGVNDFVAALGSGASFEALRPSSFRSFARPRFSGASKRRRRSPRSSPILRARCHLGSRARRSGSTAAWSRAPSSAERSLQFGRINGIEAASTLARFHQWDRRRRWGPTR